MGYACLYIVTHSTGKNLGVEIGKVTAQNGHTKVGVTWCYLVSQEGHTKIGVTFNILGLCYFFNTLGIIFTPEGIENKHQKVLK